MKKLMIAAAGAVALGLSAFAESWFSGGDLSLWPNTEGVNGAWSNTDQAEWNGEALDIFANDKVLTFTATEAKTLGLNEATSNVEFTTSIEFTYFAVDALPDAPADAKAGVITVKDGDNLLYYVLAKDPDATTNKWTATAVAATEELAQVKVLVANNGKATYTLGSEQVVVDVATLGTIQTANFVGDGVIGALSATYEVNSVEFTVAAIANTEIVAVSNNNVALEAPYVAIPGSEVVVVYRTVGNYLFSDGTNTKIGTGTAAAGEITTDVTADDVVPAKAKIGTVLYLTLQDAVNALPSSDAIELLANVSADGMKIDEAATLDLAGFTLTVNAGSAFTNNAALTVVNSDEKAGSGLVIAGEVVANALINLSSLAYGDTGLIAHQGGALKIGATGVVNFMQAWKDVGLTANKAAAQTDGFLTGLATGAQVVLAETYTWDETAGYWKVDGEVATATCQCTIIGTAYTANFTDSFSTLEAAALAVMNEEAVILTQDIGSSESPIASLKARFVGKTAELNMNGHSIYATGNSQYLINVLADANLTITGTGNIVKSGGGSIIAVGCNNTTSGDVTGKDTLGNGYLTINGTITVSGGSSNAVKVEAGKFTLTDGTIVGKVKTEADATYTAEAAFVGGTVNGSIVKDGETDRDYLTVTAATTTEFKDNVNETVDARPAGKVFAQQSNNFWKLADGYKYYAKLYLDGNPLPDSWGTSLGTNGGFYAIGTEVNVEEDGVREIEVSGVGTKNVYVSGLSLTDGDSCTFAYDGSVLTKSGDLDVTVNGTKLSYKVTTGNKACFATVYFTSYSIATLTITPVENCTIAVSNAANTAAIESGAKFVVGNNTQVNVYRTAADGYVLTNCVAAETITIVGDTNITAEVTEAKASPVPSEQADVEVEGTGDDAVAVITPKEGVTQIDITPAEGYTGKYSIPASVTKVTGVTANLLILKTTEGSWEGILALESDGTVVLDPNGYTTVEGETIAVTPTLAESAEEGSKIADGAVAMPTIPGLYYQLLGGDDPALVETAATDATQATGKSMTLKNTKFTPATEGKAFFKVQVTK